MSYLKEHYNAVLNAIIETYGLKVAEIPDWQFAAWRSATKRLFDQGILIKEIQDALPEAGNKKQWPSHTGVFKRIEDIVYLHRKEKPQVTKVDQGMVGISSLLNSPR